MATTEMYYCGNCSNEQNIYSGEKCQKCGKITVSYNTKTETKVIAQKRWESLFGKRDYGSLRD